VKYAGEWQDDKQHGFGTETFSDGSMYSGFFANGSKDGTGRFRWGNADSFSGQFLNGQIHGNGRMKWSDDSCYDGEWVEGAAHGRGRHVLADRRSYEGGFECGKKHGTAVISSSQGRQLWNGEWHNGSVRDTSDSEPGFQYDEARKRFADEVCRFPSTLPSVQPQIRRVQALGLS